MPPDLKLIVNVNQELTEAGRRGELERLRGLLAGGADASARNEYGSTPLHAAASWNDRPVAELLLDHGADLHARDWEGDTPLHIASAFGDRTVIGLLLDRGADVNARDDTGWTPLHMAARLGRVEETAFLLGRGAEAAARRRAARTLPRRPRPGTGHVRPAAGSQPEARSEGLTGAGQSLPPRGRGWAFTFGGGGGHER
jgi:ankyrin repeat protein